MATEVTKSYGNYADSVFYWVRDSSGYFDSIDGTAPSAGDQDGALAQQLLGVQQFPFAPQDPDRPSQLGDGGVIGRFINKPTELPAPDWVFGVGDLTFEALVQSLSVVTIGGGKGVLTGAYTPTFRDMAFLATSPAKSKEDASLDASMWEALFVFNANVFPRGRDAFNTNSLPTYLYGAVANYATAYPWGKAFAAGTEGDTKGVGWRFTWPYRPVVQRWTGDNSETTFNLGKNIAEDSSDNIVVFVNGTEQTWVTGVPSAGEFGVTEAATDTIVLGTAPASSAKVVAMYGWS